MQICYYNSDCKEGSIGKELALHFYKKKTVYAKEHAKYCLLQAFIANDL